MNVDMFRNKDGKSCSDIAKFLAESTSDCVIYAYGDNLGEIYSHIYVKSLLELYELLSEHFFDTLFFDLDFTQYENKLSVHGRSKYIESYNLEIFNLSKDEMTHISKISIEINENVKKTYGY